MTSPVYGAQHGSSPVAGGGRGHANPSYIGVLGAVLVLVGSFLPWVKLSTEGLSETVKGNDGDGIITLVAAIAAIVLFGVGVAMRKAAVSAAGALPGLVALVFAVLNMVDKERLPTQQAEDKGADSDTIKEVLQGLDLSNSYGIYVVLIGALVTVAGGVLAYLRGRG
ncbi:MAG: hypothetical protein HOU01_19725 [Streptomycetaceae bacterium]|jgi:hypothetical protein|nr:hypothetical protein [Streptomycetaceae bacterium]